MLTTCMVCERACCSNISFLKRKAVYGCAWYMSLNAYFTVVSYRDLVNAVIAVYGKPCRHRMMLDFMNNWETV